MSASSPLYMRAPVFEKYSTEKLEHKWGLITVNNDQDEVYFHKYKCWISTNAFQHCTTLESMGSILLHEMNLDSNILSKQYQEDHESARWNYCAFFAVGCMITYVIVSMT